MPWESLWAPYDEATYEEVLLWVGPADLVLDIGAGDLRLARRLAQGCQGVIAIEQHEALLRAAHQAGDPVPGNLYAICADADRFPFPRGITVAVLLMRHCTRFGSYRDKLIAAGCRRLITNARWGMGLEHIDLTIEPAPFTSVTIGWYACTCGSAGFIPGPPVCLDERVAEHQMEVHGCPHCS